MRAALAGLMFCALAAPVAGAPQFSFPVDCTLGDTCHIQQFMDHDPTDAVQDFLCQPLSYDTHKGTDFALPTVMAAQQGVSVFPVAPGKVLGVRDGMDDVWSGKIDSKSINGRDCGNGLVVDHGGGWHTQYCHMKNGSVAVTSGQIVTPDTVLGQIGMSGRTQFPHLHLSVRKDGAPVDPFAPDGANCDAPPAATLWSDPPTYQAGGIIGAGFATRVPDYADVKMGTADEAITRTSAAIVAYSFAFGGREGDILRMTLTGPGGLRVDDDYVLPRNRAQFFRAIGKKRRSAPWPGGQYETEAILERQGKVISRERRTFDIPR